VEEPAVKGRNTPLETAKTAIERDAGEMKRKSCVSSAYCG